MVAFGVLLSVLGLLTASALASPLTFYKNVPAEGNVICPGGDQQCPVGNTCCSVEVDKYGCCPHSNAVCCMDKKHCCPSGETCDLTSGKCLGVVADTQHPLLTLVTLPVQQKVICPNGKEECPTGDTCCSTGTDKYGCCPHINAVCCSKKTCCPQGYRCIGSKCITSDSQQQHPLLTLSMLKRPEKMEIECPGDKVTCNSEQSCCPMESGYGCCPHVDGVCCSDKKHCCPSGFSCKPSAGICTKASLSHPFLEILAQRPKKQEKQDVSDDPNPVICGNGVDTCPTGNTCCHDKAQDKYNCCPSYNAVCCDDSETCCPSGYVCDAKKQSCKMAGLEQVPFMKTVAQRLDKQEKQDVSDDPNPVICGNGVDTCPTGNTCCYNKAKDKYGCCPSYNAVCCDDGQECCPSNYVCDAKEKTCKASLEKIPFIRTLLQ